jgi:hypothetical protein
MDVLRRMFGLGPAPQNRPDQIISTGPDARLVLRQSENPTRVAAAANFAALFGQANTPVGMGMDHIIEVQDANGNWTPVTGQNVASMPMDAQVAALQSFRETGVIGPTALNPAGSMAVGAIEGGLSEGGTTPTTASSAAPELSPVSAGGGSSRMGNVFSESLLSPEETSLLDTLMRPLGVEQTANPETARLTQMLLDAIDGRVLARSVEASAFPDGQQQPDQPQGPGGLPITGDPRADGRPWRDSQPTGRQMPPEVLDSPQRRAQPNTGQGPAQPRAPAPTGAPAAPLSSVNRVLFPAGQFTPTSRPNPQPVRNADQLPRFF